MLTVNLEGAGPDMKILGQIREYLLTWAYTLMIRD